MKSASKLLVWAVFFLFPAAISAAEIGYIEDFALARDRTVPLKQLIPGTEDYYYYHAIHYQNTEQFDKVEELLAAWIKRHKYTPRVREIQNRQALLTYAKDPEKSLEFIRQRLKLTFDHQRELLDRKPNLPTSLDQKLISRETLMKEAFARHQNLKGFEAAALDWLVATELNADRRRHLLERLQRPDYPNLPKLVVDDLNYQHSRGFGSFNIHRLLLLEQLDACLKLKPDLLNQTNFVNAYLAKLHPNDDVDWRHDTEQHRAYLDRLWGFVQRLAPVHNSLKANVLYRRLVLDRSQGVYDKQQFMTYIKLPRNASYMNVEFMRTDESRRHAADLNANFQEMILLPPIGNDESLVRSYLHHFFVDETTYKPYEPYINDLYLKRNFAEAKIVNGLGEGEQWYSMLQPAEYQVLKERIDIDFAFTNAKRFAADDAVGLDLLVKNVKTLIVKVYEVNTRNFSRERLSEVNTDISLDGLVANWETTHDYTEPPLRRVRRHFDFPDLKKPGVYVIDFIGNGKSSRAVIRKGRLRHLVRTTTAGQVFTVMDEQNRKLPDATIWFAGREYAPDEKGEIVVPFSNSPTRQSIILSDGDYCTLDSFQHQAENYSLVAGIYVDRESLLQRKKANVVVRPQLYLNGTPVTLSVLEDVRLVITSTDHDGVSTTKEVADFELFEDREATYEFQTPQRLSNISFALNAKVQHLSQNKKIDLSVSESFALNEIDRTEKVEDLHLATVDGQYVLELLGRTGEPKADRPVRLSLKHRDFSDAKQVMLKTDAQGRILLGPLADIVSVTATGPEDTSHTWTLGSDQHTGRQQLHGREGESLVVTYTGKSDEPVREELSLLELRGDTFVADRFDAISVEGGLLRIADLPRGDYDLWLKRPNRRIRLRVAAGQRGEGYVLGENRQLEVRGNRPLQIAAVESGEDAVTIRLQNATKFARVHVFATRYNPAFSAYAHFSRVRDGEPSWVIPKKLDSLYVAGRALGDEYRYIIDRQYAKRYPGNMLRRPSLLLNPWAVRSTETTKQQPKTGEEFERQSDEERSAEGRAQAEGADAVGRGDFANLDFLAEASAVLVNLSADEKGVISIPREALGAHQHLHIVAVDPRATAYRSLSLPEVEAEPNDLRLANALDPQKHYAEQKQITVVDGKQQFVLGDIASSKFETYDSLGKVYSLYVTLSGDATLVEFGFLTGWPDLKPEEKRTKYSKYACHELSFFLHKKDPEFFRTVVLPYLKNKKDKQFLDHWLLGDDLRAYLDPWNYAQLNVVERILLSERVAVDRQNTSRHVSDLFALLPPNIDRFNFLFDTAVKGSALDTDDAFGIAGEQEKLAEVSDQLEKLNLSVAAGTRGASRAVRRAPRADAAAVPMEPAARDEPATERLMDELRQANKRTTLARRELATKGKGEGKDGKSSFFGKEADRAGLVRQYYQKLDKTQEWAENNYYHLPIEKQTADLITVNAFWRDYAERDAKEGGPFRSDSFAEASRSFPEMMFALAVMDLPFKAEEHETEFDKAKMTLTTGSPIVVFHEEIKPAEPVAEQTPILVSQNFFRHGDRYRHVDGEKFDKFVTDEFLIHTVYGCQVVVTNPTSSRQKLDVLLQVPLGAIPVMNGQFTRSVHIDLEPYNTQTLEYHFYFPGAGEFPHYPVHIAKNGQLLANAEPFTLNVVAKLSKIDRESWDYVSQHGTDEDVLKYLQQNNLHRTKLDRIAFRMKDKGYFGKVTQLLARRHAYDQTIWSYGIKHNEPAAVSQYLQHANGFVNECGTYIDSPLLTIDPVARKAYQHLDYRPLVNARAHALGKRRQILNDRFHAQYHRLLKILSYRRELVDAELMAVVYYLLLQDRVEEGLDFFGRVNADKLATRLQHDYFTAYLDFYSDQPKQARAIADKYADHPVDRWRDAFAAIAAQLDEIEGKAAKLIDEEDRGEVQTGLAATESSFEFNVESKQVTVNYQNLDEIGVNYYLMDIELLFSRNPFVQQYSGQFSHIRPNATATVELPKDKTSHAFALPEALHSSNVLVEITGGGQTKSKAYYSNSLSVQVIENYGQVRVTHSDSGALLAKVYVKAYARMKDGSVRFYKDGYTDLRGRFDYTSLNTNDLDFVQQFSLLILSDDHGAVVREAKPPKR